MIQNLVTREWVSTLSPYHAPGPADVAGTLGEAPEGGAGWEGQGRRWLVSQLKRGSYHFLPDRGAQPQHSLPVWFQLPRECHGLG